MDWLKLRDDFPVTAEWAFLDHAAVAPLSGPARRALIEYADDMARHGVTRSAHWLQRIEEVRRSFGKLLNADPLDIAFVKNTSEGIAFVAEGLPWQPGDNLVTAAEEYPSNLYPWLNLEGRGVAVRRVPSRGNRIDLDDINRACDARTRLVTLSFVEYASGFRNDLDALSDLCRARGIYFFVDAIQGLGVHALDVRRTPIDFLSADGHKWLLGPEGAGIFYIRRDLIDRLHPISVGWNSVVGNWDFSNIDLKLKPHAGRWESGSPNVAGIHALGASLERILEIGRDVIEARIFELTDHLCAGAARQGIEVFSDRSAAGRSGIVSLIVPGAEPKELVRRCRGLKIAINHRAGRVRVSPHVYNTHDEIDRMLVALTVAC